MMSKLEPATVRKSITVDAPVDEAFKVFTESFGRWWPANYSIGSSPLKSAIIEPRTGGRWYEIGQDGAQCDWGEVLLWDPPKRVLLAWRIRADWRFDRTLTTEVDVSFHAVGANSTRVELEHRHLENMGDSAEAARQTFESEHGWSGILAAYAQRIRGNAQ